MSVDGSEPSPPVSAGPSARRFALLGAASSLTTVGLGMVRSKLVAETVGSVGVGISAEIVQLLALVNVIATVANGPALTKWIAEAARDRDIPRLERGLGTSVVLAIALTGVAGAACVWFAPSWLPQDWPIDVRTAVALTALSTALNTVAASVLAAHVSLADIRSITLTQIVGGVLSTAALVILILTMGLSGQFVALAVGSLITASIAWIFLWRRRDPVVRVRLALDREFVRSAFTLGTTTLVSGYVLQLLLSAIRLRLEHAGAGTDGAEFNGNFQAAYTIGATYFSTVLSGVGTFYYPRYAAARGSEDLSREVHAAADFVLEYTPPLAFMAIAFRGLVIHLLYSERFDLAADMLGFMLAGDIAKAVSWSYAGPLPMRGRLRAFVLTEGFALATGVVCVWLSVDWFGPVGAGVGLLATSLAYLPLAAAVTRASCGVTIAGRHLALGSLLTLGGAGFNVAVGAWGPARWVSLPLLVLWAWRAGHIRRLQGVALRARDRFASR